MNKEQREAVIEYISLRADEAGYMSLGAVESNKFQDSLQNDEELQRIAGETLTRKYIKDTVLNNYSKKKRYIELPDILEALPELEEGNVKGTNKDFANGLFWIEKDGFKIECTSTSFGEWQTAFKRFGSNTPKHDRLIFLTCGGVSKQQGEIEEVQQTLSSYGLKSIIIKPLNSNHRLSDLFTPSEDEDKDESTGQKNVMLSKQFLLLAGISGTGKTRFVRQQASASGKMEETYCLVSVRPDWHEPSDLLGYTTNLSGRTEYVVTDVLRFVVKAWLEIIESVTKDSDGTWRWEGRSLNKIRTFWLCLDEMNLAPVEQYFADYLSILETRRWLTGSELLDYNETYNRQETYRYECDPLIKPDLFQRIHHDAREELRNSLDLGPSENDALWSYFLQHGIALPFNLIVAGTVNMDETTHGFSRKVIDRALTFDFNDFFPNDFDKYFSPSSIPQRLTYPTHSDGRDQQALANVKSDPDGSNSISFLKKVNGVLKGTPFELAYRALNELLLSVICFQPAEDKELQAVWDDFLMCKVLPRIEGDMDKLSRQHNDNNFEEVTILDDLEEVLSQQFPDIWEGESRPDLLSAEKGSGTNPLIRCRSRQKLLWMSNRLQTTTFTSFWP